ncbi:MAG: hypothetical protein EOO10_14985 [Chitinophagaceae bacterium]|nr:MAG: hypothetical protein EOO10_14985 [Chitinophagaceae bacterium]
MRRIIFSAFFFCVAFVATAQTDTTTPTKIFRPMQTRSKDHFMIQFGGATWQNKPDSIKTGGFSRTFNIYVMLDFPFKSSPKLSVALGPGLATDHVFLDKMTAGITENASAVRFRDVSDTTHFKKYKISTAFLELPIELRFSSNPDADGKSFKAALGVKVGTMIAAWAKGKNLEDRNNNSVNDLIVKEKSKRFFNTNRISATARLGYGHFTLFGSYSLTPLFKEGVGPKMNAMSVGLTLSGL